MIVHIRIVERRRRLKRRHFQYAHTLCGAPVGQFDVYYAEAASVLASPTASVCQRCRDEYQKSKGGAA